MLICVHTGQNTVIRMICNSNNFTLCSHVKSLCVKHAAVNSYPGWKYKQTCLSSPLNLSWVNSQLVGLFRKITARRPILPLQGPDSYQLLMSNIDREATPSPPTQGNYHINTLNAFKWGFPPPMSAHSIWNIGCEARDSYRVSQNNWTQTLVDLIFQFHRSHH